MMDGKNSTSIDEQDLFNYVFYPGSLTPEKKTIIESEKSFSEILEFYRNLKSADDISTDYVVKKSIAEKIPAYSVPDIIQLHPLKDPVLIRKSSNRFAADSKELKARMTTKTFVDNEKEYLIKVLNYGSMTKVFVFSTKDEIVSNFDLIIEPHNLKYHFNDNSEPLKIEKTIEADSIRLELL